MIDASYFAASYTAFWSEYTPACEHFVRNMNIYGTKRYAGEIASYEKIKRAQFIAEFAFSMFSERVKLQFDGKKQMSSAYRDTVARMAAFSEGHGLHRRLTNAEDYELFEIYDRIQSFFKYKLEGVTVRPTFKGCGFIDESEGDIIHSNTLFEVKTVDRNFRSSDIRQLVTYSALEFIAGNNRFNKIGLINPRRGVYCLYDLAFVCSEISGLPGTGLLDLIGNTVSSGQSSR